jgi:hypothetical protein
VIDKPAILSANKAGLRFGHWERLLEDWGVDESVFDEKPLRKPWYLTVCGLLLTFVGLIGVIGSLLDLGGMPGSAQSLVFSSVFIVIGVGLIGGFRWSWIAGVLLAIVEIAAGVWALLGGTRNAAVRDVFIGFYLIPGVILLALLNTDRSRLWFSRKRREPSPEGSTRDQER